MGKFQFHYRHRNHSACRYRCSGYSGIGNHQKHLCRF
jgi:hypothetical protein